MKTPRHKQARPGGSDRPERRGWRSIGQLADLWGLSRARTNLVLEGLVRSGRMEVRRVPRAHDEQREFRMLRRH